jgi:hypothetical protein
MAASHQVTCITPDGSDPDQRIDAIGGSTGAQNGGPWKLPIDEAIARIEDGTYHFWTYASGRRADVIVARRPSGRKYLKTTADGVEPNNLLALPRCP